ncbi:MAG: hypothetical protein ACXACU_11980 [Candidatus Hodarchaeales archaeon]|jgi:Fe-S-cluster containining protein
MMIRGFSLFTGYNCTKCYFKCCGSEYDLPLFPSESEEINEKFPFIPFFLKKDEDNEWLIRGDSCLFLSSEGLCILHNNQLKPIMCKTYPLIFWKCSSKDYLAWIYPCRGNGFHWIADDKNRVSDNVVNSLFHEIRDKFHSYWGEQIDHNNPFTEISVERLRIEKDFFYHNKNTSLYSKMMEFQNSGSITNKLDTLTPIKYDTDLYEQLHKVINAVLHWLSWSPVGLQLSFSNSKLIFSIAAKLIELKNSQIHEGDLQSLETGRYLHQLGTFLASAILPSFWKNIEKTENNSMIKAISAKIRAVLSGEIPQQEIGGI